VLLLCETELFVNVSKWQINDAQKNSFTVRGGLSRNPGGASPCTVDLKTCLSRSQDISWASWDKSSVPCAVGRCVSPSHPRSPSGVLQNIFILLAVD